MRNLLLSVMVMIGFSAFAQNPTTIYWLKSRVLDSTTVSTSGNYGVMFWNAQATTPHWDIWNGSTMNHVFDFNSGGGGGAITSVFGRTGVVVSATSDYDAIQIDNTPAGNISSTNAQAAINELDTEKGAIANRIDQNNAATTSAQLASVLSDEVGSSGGFARASYVDDVRKLPSLDKTASFVAAISEAGTYHYNITPASATTITFPDLTGQEGLQWAFWKNVDADPVQFDFGAVPYNGATILPDTTWAYLLYSDGMFKLAGTNPATGGGGSGTVTNVTGTSPINVATGTTTPVVSITNAAADGSTLGAASFTAADFNATSGNISIDYANGQAATSGQDGFLQAADWTTFNNKQSAITVLPVANGGTGLSSLGAGLEALRVNSTATALEYYRPATSRISNGSPAFSVSGTTAETRYSGTILIPAGTVIAGDRLKVTAMVTKTGSTDAYNFRIRYNTTDNLSGATQIAIATPTAGGLTMNFTRTFFVKTTSSQVCLNTAANAATDLGTVTSAFSTPSMVFTSDVYLILSIEMGGTTDTATLQTFTVSVE